MLHAESPKSDVAVGPECGTLAGPKVTTAVIEISDADYRTLHMPCDALDIDALDVDALDGSGNGKPGQ